MPYPSLPCPTHQLPASQYPVTNSRMLLYNLRVIIFELGTAIASKQPVLICPPQSVNAAKEQKNEPHMSRLACTNSFKNQLFSLHQGNKCSNSACFINTLKIAFPLHNNISCKESDTKIRGGHKFWTPKKCNLLESSSWIGGIRPFAALCAKTKCAKKK